MLIELFMYHFNVLAIVVIHFCEQCLCDILCETAFECVGDTIVTSQNVYGYGYKSIHGTSTSITETAYFNVYCHAAYACQNSNFMVETLPTELKCIGDHSCVNVDNILFTYIDCDGAFACMKSNLNNATFLYCDSLFSCYQSIISNVKHLSVYGAYSLMNSRIYSGGDISILLLGYLSGFNATLICQNGNECVVTCWSNGCFNFNIVCDNTSNLPCQAYYTCDESQNIYCPTFYNSTQLYMESKNNYDENDNHTPRSSLLLFDILFDYLSNIDNNQCNDISQSVTVDDYNDNLYSTYSSSDALTITDTGNLCCRGVRSCQYFTHIELNLNDMFCMASLSCNNIDSITSVSTFVCTSGDDGCQNIFINDVLNVYSMGVMWNNQIYANMTINIDIDTLLICGARKACQYSNFYGFNIIYLMAYETTGYTYLISNGNIHMDIYATIHGQDNIGPWDSYPTYIICNKTDTCYIECQASQSCTKLFILCYGICYINCNVDIGIECPYIVSGSNTYNKSINYVSQYYTNPPTYQPTIPTANPTTYPTYQPTPPTYYPTNFPSDPTREPSNFPTYIPTEPTLLPTNIPTILPTLAPTDSPTPSPTNIVPFFEGIDPTIEILIIIAILICILVFLFACIKYKVCKCIKTWLINIKKSIYDIHVHNSIIAINIIHQKSNLPKQIQMKRTPTNTSVDTKNTKNTKNTTDSHNENVMSKNGEIDLNQQINNDNIQLQLAEEIHAYKKQYKKNINVKKQIHLNINDNTAHMKQWSTPNGDNHIGEDSISLANSQIAMADNHVNNNSNHQNNDQMVMEGQVLTI